MNIETAPAQGDKYELITFSIGDQDFCMDIMLVREIRGWTNVTMLPHSPEDVMGVMNLRGAVVPIVDLSAGRVDTQQGAELCDIIPALGTGQKAVMPDAVEPVHCPAGDCGAICREAGRTWIRKRRMNSGVARRMTCWRSPNLMR